MKKSKKYLIGCGVPLVFISTLYTIGCSGAKYDNSNALAQKEIERINSLNLSLRKDTYNPKELENINEDNFLNELKPFQSTNKKFKYSIIEFNKSNNKFIFKIKVNVEDSEKISKTFTLLYLSDTEKEAKRINESNLTLKKSKFTQADLNLITKENFLENLNINLFKDKFDYVINSFSKINSWFTFTINVILKTDTTCQSSTKQFSLRYEIISSDLPEATQFEIQAEVKKFNKTTPSLKNKNFTQLELNSINENNFLDYVNGFTYDKNKFNYRVTKLNKNTNKKVFEFIIGISTLKGNFEQQTNQYLLPFEISINNTELKAEVERLNKLNITLKKSNLTQQELIDINVKNLPTLLNGIILNERSFKYRYDFLQKSLSPTKEIKFKILVASINVPDWKNYEFTNDFVFSFNLIQEQKPVEKVNDDYLKNNIANPYTDGRYSFATPGTGGNSINPSGGPTGVTPSEGVEKHAKLDTGRVHNNVQLNQLKNTFSLGFCNYNTAFSFGTGWILDYKLTEDGSYPTTWYIATNSHVIQNLKVPNDVISPSRYEIENDNFKNTEYVWIETVANPKIGVNFGNSKDNPSNFHRAKIPAAKAKTIFIGNDYLTTSPGMFSNNPKWKNSEEYIDFAVMEITFKDSAEAQTITSNYVNEPERHFKYRKESLLKSNNVIENNNYSVVGFPVAPGNQTSYWRPTQLTTSRPADELNKKWTSDQLSSLASSPFYNTFENKKGMFDAALGLSFFSYNYRQAYGLETPYNLWGLLYPVDYDNLTQGSSGSQLIDRDGYTVGIHFAIDPDASIGLSVALYCEGFNYQGKFGKYNLQGYDLINGGFPNQKISYKGNLKRLYGDGFKTKLFPNGLK